MRVVAGRSRKRTASLDKRRRLLEIYRNVPTDEKEIRALKDDFMLTFGTRICAMCRKYGHKYAWCVGFVGMPGDTDDGKIRAEHHVTYWQKSAKHVLSDRDITLWTSASYMCKEDCEKQIAKDCVQWITIRQLPWYRFEHYDP